VQVSGTVQDIGDWSIWIFDFAQDEHGRRVFYRANDLPLEVADGSWSFVDRPIGNGSSDIGQRFSVAVVEASASCAQILKDAQPNQSGDVVFPALPAGCQEIGRRDILKDRA
jgi:hypothetical protein